jgi:hypothetical protein
VKPIFLVDDVTDTDTSLLDRHGFQYEVVMNRSAFSDLSNERYDRYLNYVIDGMRFRYDPARVVTLALDEALHAQLPLTAEA